MIDHPALMRQVEPPGDLDVITTTVRPRSFEEMDQRVHEATHVAVALDYTGRVCRAPKAIAYGECEEQALYRLNLKLQKVPVDAFGDPSNG